MKERSLILSDDSGNCEIPEHVVNKGFELPQDVEGQVGVCGGIKPPWAFFFIIWESHNMQNVLWSNVLRFFPPLQFFSYFLQSLFFLNITCSFKKKYTAST